MHKSLPVAAVFAVAISWLAPAPAGADHVFAVPDALDCLHSAESFTVTDPDQSDRGASCEKAPDGSIALYVGGEGQTETAYDDPNNTDPAEQHQAGDPCGAVVIGGSVASATRVDDPATPENEQLDWDWIHTHPGPDGLVGTTDDVPHHHTCD